jgi:energy-converting hydrogenase Eha subunit A
MGRTTVAIIIGAASIVVAGVILALVLHIPSPWERSRTRRPGSSFARLPRRQIPLLSQPGHP